MRKILSYSLSIICGCLFSCFFATPVRAVPADPSWQIRTLSDGTPVSVRLNGDELYHYWQTADGRLAIEQADGTFVISDKPLPSTQEIQTRRKAARARRAPNAVGTPNLPPRGVVILVNFSDSKLRITSTRSVFDNLCNAYECTKNKYEGVNYGSAAQYFEDQSNGAYRPQFDIIGPVTLPQPTAYYGEEGKLNESDEDTQNDLYMADFVIDAILAAETKGCDFTQYDFDGDGYVDFVYFIYAGMGQASGGSSETIWPHNWSLISALYLGHTHGTSEYYFNDWYNYNLPTLDGKIINNYACSSELDSRNALCGIGTLCHEFGHVMGLPDLYDTKYADNYNNHLTPSEWDIMDAGSYNGGGHCPPNYDPWEKAFFGWVEPVSLSYRAANGILYPNGTPEYNVYQIDESNSQKAPTETGIRYYLENRQLSGWDTYLPSHGMLIWEVNFDEELWNTNTPNNLTDDPHMTVVCSSGTMRGNVWEYNPYTRNFDHINDGTNNVFGSASGVDSWEGVLSKPVTEITETNDLITFKYKGGVPEGMENWYYYDDGSSENSIGTNGSSFWWGIMIPAGSVQTLNPLLTHIAVAETTDHNTQPITIDIYSGGNKPLQTNKAHTQTVQPSDSSGWAVIELSNPISVNPQKNLWIILSEGTDTHPAIVCPDTGDPNGRWISTNGTDWLDLADYNLNYTFMLRAYIVGQYTENIEVVSSPMHPDSSRKILHGGQLLILRDGKIYNVLGTEIR